MQNPILVLATNTALGGLVSRILRLQHVYAMPKPIGLPAESIHALSPRGVIWVGEQLGTEGHLPADLSLLKEEGIPVLALGDIATALCLHFGGQTTDALSNAQAITLGLTDSPLFEGISGGERMLRNLRSLSLPDGLSPLATATEQCIGFRHATLPLYALEYPIEHNDPDAAQLLYNFATAICNAPAAWDDDTIIQRALAEITTAVGDGHVLCAVSGGIDSAVCAKLAHMAVADKLTCLFIDTGLLRDGEAEDVVKTFQETMGLTVHTVDAGKDFLTALAKASSRKEKECIAKELLSQQLQAYLAENPQIETLVLGTNYNDTLYASQGPLLHGDAPPAPGCRVVAPLRELFKEEVRRLGAALALPSSIVDRQSFPSGGLALRITGRVTPARLALLRRADAFFQEEIRAGGHEKKLWQYYASLSETPGARGSYTVVLRALQAAQGKAYAARLPYDLLERVTERICNQIEKITYVVYNLTPTTHYEEQE